MTDGTLESRLVGWYYAGHRDIGCRLTIAGYGGGKVMLSLTPHDCPPEHFLVEGDQVVPITEPARFPPGG